MASLLCSDDSEDRSFAVDKIIKIRDGKDFGDLSVRSHTTPTIVLNATSPKELVNWDGKIHEPVFTCQLSLSELEELRNRPLEIPSFTLHTQSCERSVQEVSKASTEVHGETRRDGWVRARVAHREFMPVFASKKDILKM